MDAGRSLRRARRRAGLSQRSLAAATGVSRSTIARIEGGAEDPRLATLSKLLAACHHRLEMQPNGGEGIDRTAIREMLALTPTERALLATAEGRAMEQIPEGTLRDQRVLHQLTARTTT